jgi:hypothetical protein
MPGNPRNSYGKLAAENGDVGANGVGTKEVVVDVDISLKDDVDANVAKAGLLDNAKKGLLSNNAPDAATAASAAAAAPPAEEGEHGGRAWHILLATSSIALVNFFTSHRPRRRVRHPRRPTFRPVFDSAPVY